MPVDCCSTHQYTLMPAARKRTVEKPGLDPNNPADNGESLVTQILDVAEEQGTAPPFPNYKNFPDLSEVAEEKDFSHRVIGTDRDTGKEVTAKYLNHMTVARLLKVYAPGWEFELKPYVDANGIESDVWPAPNGSGYLKGFFRAPVGSGFKDTTCYPYAITNNKNKALAANLLSCTDICNSERRAMAACAARFFSLAWDAWAGDHTQDQHAAPDNFVQQVDVHDVTPKPDPEPTKQLAPLQVAPMTAAAPAAIPESISATKPELAPTPAAIQSIEERVNQQLLPHFKTCWGFDETVFARWQQDFKLAFNIQVEQPNVSEIQTEEQFKWCSEWVAMEMQKIQAVSR